MRTPIVIACLGLLTVAAQADTRYYTVYWHDIRLGYTRITSKPDTYEGKPAIRTDTFFEHTVVYMGRKISGVTETTEYTNLDKRPLREILTNTADGRVTWRSDFQFGEKNVEIDQQTSSKVLHTTVPIPSSPFYFDESALIAQKCPNPGDTFEINHFLSGMGVENPTFIPFHFRNLGYTHFNIKGQNVKAIICEEQFADSTVRRNRYITPTGEEIRFEYPSASVAYVLATQDLATSPLPKNLGNSDIVYESCIQTSRLGDKKIDHVDQLAEMRVTFQDLDLSTAPSDESQTVVKGISFQGYSYTPTNPWSVDIHPTRIADSIPTTIEDAAKGQEQWTKPDIFMPSDDPKMKELAAKVIAKQKTVVGAILAIKNYVGHLMKAKPEMGAPRDALQILHDRTGTCSDYTILTVTLLRASGIAARSVSGLVTWDTRASLLFMHGWAEAWDGKRWIGVDATDKHDQLSACHIKLWQGDMASRLSYQMDDPSKASALIYDSKPIKL